MTTTRHPITNLHYVMVIPSTWGPFVDVRACYEAVARRYPWLSVITPEEFELIKTTPVYQDPVMLFVQWCQIDPGPKDARKALVTLVYSEAKGNNMLPDHVREWDRFFLWAPNYDAVFGHTPWMVEQLSYTGCPAAYLLPLGWDPEAMGTPRFSTIKQDDAVFYGSMVGKRNLVIPHIQAALGTRMKNISGCFGRTLSGMMDSAKASLYIAHSDVESFSTWRMWQTAATSAALIAEPGDTWPFVSGEHFWPIDRITFSNLDKVINDIRWALDNADLLVVARKAHDLARDYTVETCVTKYLVQASQSMVRR